MREAGGEQTAMLGHDNDNRARRHETDDSVRKPRPPDDGTHSGPADLVLHTSTRKTTTTARETGAINCQEVDDWGVDLK